MEQRPSQLLNRLSESATIAMARKATELKQSGVDVISLSLGEPDFDTPEVLKLAGIEAIENNITHYTPVPGLQDVREAIIFRHLVYCVLSLLDNWKHQIHLLAL